VRARRRAGQLAVAFATGADRLQACFTSEDAVALRRMLQGFRDGVRNQVGQVAHSLWARDSA